MSTELVIVLLISGFIMSVIVVWMVLHNRRVSRLEASVASIQSDLGHLPTKDDIHEVALALTEVKAEVQAGRESARSLRASVDRIEGFLHGREQRSTS